MSLDSRMAARRNALLGDLITAVEARLIENEIPATIAAVVAADLADFLADHWGGQMLYIPRDYQRKLLALELEILNAHRGDNYPELAKQYGMTDSGVRRLVKRIRAKLAKARSPAQLDMLETPPQS